MADVRIFDWDDEIENDGEERSFVVLEEGDYDFEVVKFERGHYTPSADAKTPPCNQAIVTLKVSVDEGDCLITEKLPMASTMEWKISAFFRSIGLKKHGEKLKMKWNETIGCKGRAHITKTQGSKNDGVYFNNVGRFLDPVAKAKESKSEVDDEWN